MSTAFPPMPGCSLPIQTVESHSRCPSTGPPGMGPGGEYAVDRPAAAGPRAAIGGKTEKRPLGNGDIKHRPAGPSRPCCRQTRPRREHGGSSAWCSGSRPSIPVNTWGRVDSTRLGGPQDDSLISVAGLGDWPHLIMCGESRWFPLAAGEWRGHHEGMCRVLTATRFARGPRT
jgi:hypothetical protein